MASLTVTSLTLPTAAVGPPSPLPLLVLEDDAVRATVLVDLGGRPWSRYDERAGRELRYEPDASSTEVIHGRGAASGATLGAVVSAATLPGRRCG